MHLGLNVALAVISIPLSPQRTPQILWEYYIFVSRSGPGHVRFPQLSVLAQLDNRMGIASRSRIVAFACILCSVRCNISDLFVWWNLVVQIKEHMRIPCLARDCKKICWEGQCCPCRPLPSSGLLAKPWAGIGRSSGPDNPRCYLHKVLKSGTAQSSPTSSNRLSRNTVVCLKAKANNTLIMRQACMAASLYVC